MYWNILFGYSNTLVGASPNPGPGRFRAQSNTPYGVAEPQAELVVLLPSVAGFPLRFTRKIAAAAAKGLTRPSALSYDKDTGGQRHVSVKALKHSSAPERLAMWSFREGLCSETSNRRRLQGRKKMLNPPWLSGRIFSRGLTYFPVARIIIVQGRQRRVSVKALKHSSVPESLAMRSFQ